MAASKDSTASVGTASRGHDDEACADFAISPAAVTTWLSNELPSFDVDRLHAFSHELVYRAEECRAPADLRQLDAFIERTFGEIAQMISQDEAVAAKAYVEARDRAQILRTGDRDWPGRDAASETIERAVTKGQELAVRRGPLRDRTKAYLVEMLAVLWSASGRRLNVSSKRGGFLPFVSDAFDMLGVTTTPGQIKHEALRLLPQADALRRRLARILKPRSE